jgi:hypothetical protein
LRSDFFSIVTVHDVSISAAAIAANIVLFIALMSFDWFVIFVLAR